MSEIIDSREGVGRRERGIAAYAGIFAVSGERGGGNLR